MQGVALIVVPLLYETGLYTHCDRVIVVTAPIKKRIQRLVQRDNIDEELAYNMITAQSTDEARNSIAHLVIENDSSPSMLKSRILSWWTENIEKIC